MVRSFASGVFAPYTYLQRWLVIPVCIIYIRQRVMVVKRAIHPVFGQARLDHPMKGALIAHQGVRVVLSIDCGAVGYYVCAG